ncbi:MAG: LLM class flavin-dependent oxidoreductase [bacterium]|nr:LLM class flavin-dependent oxidoreductase [bacterium]
MTDFFLRTYAFPAEVEAAAIAAEADGWDGLLFQDSQNLTPDITVSMTLAARVTDRIAIGTAVTNLVTRNPAVVASTFATIHQLSGGRAILGVARGDTALHLVGEEAPSAERFGDLLDEARTYLSGGVVRLGETESRLAWLPSSDLAAVPVNVFASGPRNLAVAAAHGDQVTVAVGAEVDQVAWAVQQVRAVNPSIPVGALIVAGVGTDLPALRELVRANASISTHFRRDAGEVLSAADAAVVSDVTRDYDNYRHATAHSAQAQDLPDDFLDRFCVIGTPDECVARLTELSALGLDHVVILGGGRDADPRMRHESDEFFAREVLPGLR